MELIEQKLKTLTSYHGVIVNVRLAEARLPDGSTGKGVFVQCRNFYGKLSLFRAYDGKSFRCTVQDQDAFLQQVYGIISSEP